MSQPEVVTRRSSRWNVVDVAAGGFVLLLIPLGLALYLLFREAPPVISTIDPVRVEARQPSRVRLTGQNLRPFLRVVVGDRDAGTLLLESPTAAEVRVPALASGVYDLVLLDVVQEVARVHEAIRVGNESDAPGEVASVAMSNPGAPKQTVIQVVGEFERLTPAEAAQIQPQVNLGQVARVLAVQPPLPGLKRVRSGGTSFLTMPAPDERRVPVIVQVACEMTLDACHVNNRTYPTLENATMELPFPGPLYIGPPPIPQILLFVHEVRAVDAPLEFPATATR